MTDDAEGDENSASDGDDLLALLDELRITGLNGLEYADDPYDETRYRRILKLACEWYGRSLDLPAETVRERFASEVGRVTPKVSADAAVFDDEGRILLQRRTDDETWCLPGGYTDPNESPRETAVRETREETGLSVEPLELVGVYTRRPGEYGPHCLVVHLYRCAVERGDLELSHEGTDLQYWSLANVPEWHKNHEQMARDARRKWTDAR
ncbi:NUDIX hydrolase N-terminal domain-containing protein [Halorussus halophilus]|uniref:NUDIX hydrolase N-terminal domain-containing protein n=1 Tax=Halorussus halophilus TaxID=2650975 RepID=UPI0013014A0D|nr:NUDIX hydrolase N-terminal domain-containing protein [Halorussus halophilus]